jgi:AcrR family transcriptional regulator
VSDVGADAGDRSTGSGDRLLDAALQVFGSKGFVGATTKEIANLAGVNEVTLFRHFESKNGLFEAVLKERFPRSQLIRELHFDRSVNMQRGLIENGQKLVEILNANRDFVKIVHLDLPRLAGRTREDPYETFFVGQLVGFLSANPDTGSIPLREIEAASDLFYGTLISYFLKNYIMLGKAPNPSSDHLFVELAVGLFLRGLMSQHSAQKPGQKRKTVK